MDTLGNLKFALYTGLGQRFWDVLALFGEAMLLLPAAALIVAWLWRQGRRSEAQIWGLSIIACVATVGLLKLSFPDFQWTVLGHTFNSRGFPSGHVAMATAFWGGLALLMAERRLALLLLLPIPVVALTVLVLWWHHTLDVVVGFVIAAAALTPLLLRAPRRSPRSAF